MNILDVTEGIIIHQVNCQNVMGAGVALQLSRKYPIVKQEYHNICNRYSDKHIFGAARVDRIEILKDKNKEYTAFVLKVDKPRENDIIKIEDEGIKSFNREFYDKKTGKFDYDKLFFDEEYNKKADTNFAFSFYRRGIANDNKLEHINLGDGMYSFLRDNNNVKKVIQSFKDNNIKTFSVSSGYSDNPSYIKSFVDNGAKIVDVGKLVNGKEAFILEV